LLLPNKDFASFCKTNHNHFTTLCDVSKAEWIRKDSELHFHIVANRFLRNMVRAIVGTLLEVGEGKITLENFKKILEEKNRSAAGLSVPALGLYLNHIKYPYL
jgi:tRNA pseudouridine38-40 synthase